LCSFKTCNEFSKSFLSAFTDLFSKKITGVFYQNLNSLYTKETGVIKSKVGESIKLLPNISNFNSLAEDLGTVKSTYLFIDSSQEDLKEILDCLDDSKIVPGKIIILFVSGKEQTNSMQAVYFISQFEEISHVINWDTFRLDTFLSKISEPAEHYSKEQLHEMFFPQNTSQIIQSDESLAQPINASTASLSFQIPSDDITYNDPNQNFQGIPNFNFEENPILQTIPAVTASQQSGLPDLPNFNQDFSQISEDTQFFNTAELTMQNNGPTGFSRLMNQHAPNSFQESQTSSTQGFIPQQPLNTAMNGFQQQQQGNIPLLDPLQYPGVGSMPISSRTQNFSSASESFTSESVNDFYDQQVSEMERSYQSELLERDRDFNYISSQYAEEQRENSELSDVVADLTAKLENTTHQKHEPNLSLDELPDKMEELKEILSATQKEINEEVKKQIAGKEAQISSKNKLISRLQSEKQRLEKEINDLNVKLAEKDEKLASSEEFINKVKEAIAIVDSL
jgi:hypothetical protein